MIDRLAAVDFDQKPAEGGMRRHGAAQIAYRRVIAEERRR